MAGQAEQGFGFGALDRLHQPAEFAAVMSSRARACGGCFELRYRSRQPADGGTPAAGARLGLIIPKRLARRAVLRNLLKRLARESFRGVRSGLPPVDIVVRLAKPPMMPGQSADAERRRAWRRNIDELLAGVAK